MAPQDNPLEITHPVEGTQRRASSAASSPGRPRTPAGRVAAVTGAAGLLGAPICAELVRHGVQVIAMDTTEIRMDGAEFHHVDIGDPAAVATAAAAVAADHSHVNWLIHAAAITGRTPGRDLTGPLETLPLDTWQDLLRVNLTGALILVQTFLPQLKLSPDPAVLLIGSIQGHVPTLNTGAYGVTKAALAGLTRQLAAELAQDAIAVNLLAPGPIAAEDEIAELAAAGFAQPTPMARFGSPQEFARAVACIIGQPFRYMTGAIIPFDGGEHLRPRPGIARHTRATGQER